MKELREFVLTLVCVLCLAGCGTSSEDTANTFEGNLKTEEQSETNINNEADDTLVEEAFDIAISHSYFVDVEEEGSLYCSAKQRKIVNRQCSSSCLQI